MPASRRSHRPRAAAGAVAVAVALSALLSGCGADNSDSTASGGVTAVAAFYPLQYVTEQVGGNRVTVTNVTKPGVEPHDLELAPQDLGALTDADLAVYLDGFQPAVDEAVANKSQGEVLDVSDAADLSLTYTPDEAVDGSQPTTDPHFWLDPMRLADVADAVAASLGQLDPQGQAQFEANATKLRQDLVRLDDEYRSTLRSCRSRDLVTSHSAFGYLADAYDLTQVGITGLAPQGEPSPQDLATVTDYVSEHDVQTIFYEPLSSPDLADTVAAATGASTDVLDPIEGLTDTSQGEDYLAVMRANLANLKAGLGCR